MNVLVFGGNGLLGKALKIQFTESKYFFYSASRSVANDYPIDLSNYNDFSILPCNFFDVVIHCATVLPGGDILSSSYLNNIYHTNILGTQNICKWISTQNTIKKIINCSSLSVVNKPWNLNLSEDEKTYPLGDHVLYCGSKLLQELMVTTFASKQNINFQNLRFSAIYGEEMPKSGIIWNLFNQTRSGSNIKITNGSKVSFDFIHVKDAAKAITAIVNSNSLNGIINVASGVETTLLNLSEIIKNKTNLNISIQNEEHPESVPNYSKINVSKLNEVVNTANFITIEEGIDEIFFKWNC